MRQSCFAPTARSVLVLLMFLAADTVSLQAEDVIVTATLDSYGTLTPCPPSCCADLGTSTTTAYYSTAIPAGVAPRKSRFANSPLATWSLMPTLGAISGAYRVYVTKGTGAFTFNVAPGAQKAGFFRVITQ